MGRTIELGAFTLNGLLGRGGMGEVWDAVHRASGTPVAVKVLSPDVAAHPAVHRALLEETRAAAGLDHPQVITVLDCGDVAPAAEAASGGQLTAGTPYLVVERASGGSLRELVGTPLRWPALRALLTQVLSALAHAHALGIVHLDLKPENVLLCTEADMRPGLKLMDFGLAWSVRDPLTTSSISGTPGYMAPEQLSGQRWRMGPWTDLFAVGALGWELATAQRPFAGLRRGPELPPLRPLCEAPADLEGWLNRLLAEDPEDRFARAAEAAAALPVLGTATLGAVTPAPPQSDGAVATWFLEDEPVGAVDRDPFLASEAPAAPRVAGLPSRWARGDPGLPVPRLAGAGLGLLSLRRPRFVGRSHERDRIWAALRQTEGSREPVGIGVTGPPRSGRSRLVEWCCSRAHELGSWQIIYVDGRLDGGPGEALRRALARHLRVEGITPARSAPALQRHLAADGATERERVQRLAEALARPEGGLPQGLGRWTLVRLARQRPLAVWVEQPDADRALGRLLADLLASPAAVAAPLFFALIEEPPAPFSTGLGLEVLALQDLSKDQLGALARGMLPLEAGLLSALELSAQGSPGRLVSQLSRAIEADQLTPGTQGYGLAPGARIAPEDDAQQALLAQVGHLWQHLPPDAQPALELVGFLPQPLAQHTWLAALGPGGTSPASRAAGALILANLASQEPDGLALRSPSVAAALRQVAAGADRSRGHHATALSLLPSDPSPQQRLLRARHLQGLDRRDEAAADLHAAGRRIGQPDPHAGELVVREEAAVLGAIGVGTDTVRWGRNRVLLAQIRMVRADYAAAAPLYAESRAIAEACDDPALLAHALRGEAELLWHAGEVRAARDLLDQALLQFDRTGERSAGAAATWLVVGRVEKELHRLDHAAAAYAHAEQRFKETDDLAGVADAARSLGDLHIETRDPHAALAHYERAIAAYEAAGTVMGVAQCHNNRSSVYRQQGRLAEARADLRVAVDGYDDLAPPTRNHPRVNLAIMAVLEGEHAEALHWLEPVRDSLLVGAGHYLGTLVRAALLPCLCAAGAWDGALRHLDDLEARLTKRADLGDDLLGLLACGQREAAAAGRPELGDRIDALAAGWAARCAADG